MAYEASIYNETSKYEVARNFYENNKKVLSNIAAAAVIMGLSTGLYSKYDDYYTKESKDEIKAEVVQEKGKGITLEDRLRSIENIVGVPLGYQVIMPFHKKNARLTPYSSGLFTVEEFGKNGQIETKNTFTYTDMRNMLRDYLSDGEETSQEDTIAFLKANPQIFCGIDKLALDYALKTKYTENQFEQAYRNRFEEIGLNPALGLEQIGCNIK